MPRGIRRGVHQEPGQRRVDLLVGALRRRRLHGRQHGPSCPAAAHRRHRSGRRKEQVVLEGGVLSESNDATVGLGKEMATSWMRRYGRPLARPAKKRSMRRRSSNSRYGRKCLAGNNSGANIIIMWSLLHAERCLANLGCGARRKQNGRLSEVRDRGRRGRSGAYAENLASMRRGEYRRLTSSTTWERRYACSEGVCCPKHRSFIKFAANRFGGSTKG